MSYKQNTISLCDSYRDYFPIGAAVEPENLTLYDKLLTRHFNSLTVENAMKFSSIHPDENTYTFERADTIVDYAVKHSMKVRGHTLVWHQVNPEWVFLDKNGNRASRETMLARLKEHISAVVGRYKDKVYCWDVVNEAIADKGSSVMRKSEWLEALGEEYLQKAFEFAHEADPGAYLFYNDYNTENEDKRNKIFHTVKMLLDKGTPVHGIGIQGHWFIYNPGIDEIRETIEKFAVLGLQIQITELDMSVYEYSYSEEASKFQTAEMQRLQEERFDALFKMFREYRGLITGVTFWGVADDNTWLDNFPAKGRKNWPLIFDVEHIPKNSFHKIVAFSKPL